MEKINFKTESIFWVLLVIPFVYAAYVWNALPATIPVHFGIDGEPNGWGPKAIVFLTPVIAVFNYFLFLFIGKIDPKRMNDESTAGIFNKIRWVLTIFLFFITIVATRSMVVGKWEMSGGWMIGLPFLLFAVLGNYMINVKPNWFIGVRTPWTLSSDLVWKKTHQVTGKLWFYGGLICFGLSFLIDKQYSTGLILVFAIVSSLFGVAYSFWLYKKEQRQIQE
jgi:uncharacterized membrane protein